MKIIKNEDVFLNYKSIQKIVCILI